MRFMIMFFLGLKLLAGFLLILNQSGRLEKTLFNVKKHKKVQKARVRLNKLKRVKAKREEKFNQMLQNIKHDFDKYL